MWLSFVHLNVSRWDSCLCVFQDTYSMFETEPPQWPSKVDSIILLNKWLKAEFSFFFLHKPQNIWWGVLFYMEGPHCFKQNDIFCCCCLPLLFCNRDIFWIFHLSDMRHQIRNHAEENWRWWFWNISDVNYNHICILILSLLSISLNYTLSVTLKETS